MDCNTCRNDVACSLERRWIAEGTRHIPERQNSEHGITLIVIDPFVWIEPVAHLSERKICARVKWISVTSRLSCRVFNPHFGTFGKYSDKFGFRKNWITDSSRHFTIIMSCVQSTNPHFGTFGQIRLSEKLNKCHFTSLHDYHVVCSIHTSEHSVNFWTKWVFGKIRPLGNYRFRTYVILHCLNQIRNFYNFLVKICFHHNICHHQLKKKCFKISFLALCGL